MKIGKKSGTPPKKGPASQGMNLKVIKLRGGGMDMGNAANQARSAAMGNAKSTPGPGDTGGAGGFDRDTQQFGTVGSSPTSTGGGTPPKAPPKLPPKDNFIGYADMCECLQGSDVEESWYLNTIFVVRQVL